MAKKLKSLLLERGYPIRRVVLFGSVAADGADEQSDIDIAVVTDPFRSSRMREGGEILLASKDIDARIETVTMHPEDLLRPFCALAHEIETKGVDV